MPANSMLLFTSISQWTLFLGIALIIFGWIEKRNNFVLAGQFVFLALGFLGLWIILTRNMPVQQIGDIKLSKEAKALAHFKSTVYLMGFSVLSLVLEFFKVKHRKFSVYFLMLFALMLFFMVFNVQQMSN